VENRSARDLTDCWLVAPGTRIALGDLPRGESWTRTFPPGAGGEGAGQHRGEAGLRKITFRESARDLLFHAALFPQDAAEGPWRTGAALFFGWVKDPEPRFELGAARIGVVSYAFYRAIVPLAAEEE
jgi:hypothetical protein